MSFPPSEFLQAQSEFLAAVSVRSALLDMRPDLAERVYVTDSSPVMLSIDAGTGGRVILAKARAGYAKRVWMVADSRADAPDSLWNADTTASILAMSALAHLDAATTSRRLPSPWRWNQSESTLLTQLADELDRRGLTPQSVADGNRLYVYRGDAGREIRTWPTTLGRFISLPRPSGQIVITQNCTVGWTVDADVLDSKYRLDPSRILHKSSPVWPGVPVQEVSPNKLAAAVEELLKGAETEPSLSTSQRSEDRGDQNSETRLTSQVLAWAYSIGFSDVQWRRSRPNRLELTAGGRS